VVKLIVLYNYLDVVKLIVLYNYPNMCKEECHVKIMFGSVLYSVMHGSVVKRSSFSFANVHTYSNCLFSFDQKVHRI